MKRAWWFAFTPAGTLLLETGAPARERAISKLIWAAQHMPYRTWADLEKRGYTIEKVGGLRP